MEYVLTTTLDDVKVTYQMRDIDEDEVVLINFDVIDNELVKVI